ncbi:sel1 repeat family protein [Crenobacter sp. SG2305]|uniref:SEL1-like repeat protein n=1 Tax=Crenobacter oryzisoli TaxID=3056844 RepID=UPI0025AABFE3|nr:sel1 repeat family protein [Crenobacter sp. SG2305]MDN0084093.1 sel1 repeat family protein [Crenobacter sp. SG2305]
MAQQPDLKAVQARLAFSCVHEADHLPKLNPEADQLFHYARWLQLQYQPELLPEAGRLYRIAAAHGHYKANNNLQRMVRKGEMASPDAVNEVLDLAEQLVADNIPNGYYLTGHYLQAGYGYDQDNEKALMYFRKAADLGSADAQAYVGDLLSEPELAPEIARQMWRCAAEQGHAEAADSLGVDLQGDKHYPEALHAYQQAVKAGRSETALRVQNSFDAEKGKLDLNYLNVQPDPERVKRYKAIGAFLDRYDGRNPKLPDIDKIVPLPPAKLPPWDGTFEWEKEWKANAAPPKPDDKLVLKLARAKNLDPATGLPKTELPKPQTPPSIKLGYAAPSQATCPQSGIWCADLSAHGMASVSRHFIAGERFPTIPVPQPLSWLDRLRGKPDQQEVAVTWTLQSYADTQES